jgi:putative transposase
MLAHRESAELAKRLIRDTLAKEGIETEGELILHSDRGPSMTSKMLGQFLAGLAITRSLSRPYTSNDNPFSEAHFRTVKYRPEFPDRFGSYEHGLSYLRRFFPWYNEEHRHSGIGFFTPGQVHRGEVELVIEQRGRALQAAFRAHPERFKGRRPVPPAPPGAVWINPPALDRHGDPSTRSRQNLQLDAAGAKTDALSASRSHAIEVVTGVGTPEITPVAACDDQLGGHVLRTVGQ